MMQSHFPSIADPLSTKSQQFEKLLFTSKKNI